MVSAVCPAFSVNCLPERVTTKVPMAIFIEIKEEFKAMFYVKTLSLVHIRTVHIRVHIYISLFMRIET